MKIKMNGIVKRIFGLVLVGLLCVSCGGLPSLAINPWKVVPLPTDADLADIALEGDRGWIVGSNATLLETADGGLTWQAKELDLGEGKYRFDGVSFAGQEGWIVGAPSVLLHTTDGGSSWERIPLNSNLPGQPRSIQALEPHTAEMVTSVGALYQTKDDGKTWQALVQQAVGVVRNVSRADDGSYISVSSNGSFYSTWEPGQEAWQPHNRYSSRRIQNMGFADGNRLWMLARGGQVQFSQPGEAEEWEEPQYPEMTTSWGLLDLAYRTPEEIWVAGGSGNLLCSLDGGATWQKDRAVEDVPANLYKVEFSSSDRGFILGQRGTLLRYAGATEQAKATS